MSNKPITERQQFWLDHLKAADDQGMTLVAYAKDNDLKVKDLYQWKTSLTRRGFWAASTVTKSADFVAVKTKSPSTLCSLVLPNGIRLEFQGALSSDLIKTMVNTASQLS